MVVVVAHIGISGDVGPVGPELCGARFGGLFGLVWKHPGCSDYKWTIQGSVSLTSIHSSLHTKTRNTHTLSLELCGCLVFPILSSIAYLEAKCLYTIQRIQSTLSLLCFLSHPQQGS